MIEEQQIFYAALGLTIAHSAWELFLEFRQRSVCIKNEKVPQEISEVFDEDTFTKSRLYALDKSNLYIVESVYKTLISTAMIWNFMLYHVWEKSKLILVNYGFNEGNEILITAMFLVILNIIDKVCSLPLDVYYTFFLEEKHGFNKQTVSFFIKDHIKSFIVMNVLVVPLTCAAIYIIQAGGKYFFIYLWLFLMVALFFLMTIYPDVIAPLFDKYTPLPDGELKNKIEELSASVEFPLKKLYLVEGSKRTVHSNAYFYGFFKNKRIVLYDTLLKSDTNGDKGCENNEILAILAHELGHWKHNHVALTLVIMQIDLLLQFFAFGLLFKYPQLYKAFGFQKEQPIIIGLLIIFQFVFAPYNSISSFFMTVLSRKHEYQADEYAKKLGMSKDLQKALIKLHKDNLSFPVYDWLYSSWNHSHPSLLQRLQALEDKQD